MGPGSLRAPLSQQEGASFDTRVCGATSTLQAYGVECDRVERLESHLALLQRQLAASPATVAGRPSHDPTGSSEPSASTDQP